MGILIGDGQLSRYGTEDILEPFYSLAATQCLNASADYQLIVDPACTRYRGPGSVLGLRLHAQF